jgi:hypothetical protein
MPRTALSLYFLGIWLSAAAFAAAPSHSAIGASPVAVEEADGGPGSSTIWLHMGAFGPHDESRRQLHANVADFIRRTRCPD